MNPRLLVPRATVHPEAAAWRSAVVANGGSVSASTMKAVNDFCSAIDAAGLRDRFYRLNLFCGTGLNACLVPLYRGPSLSGTQYGNVTDTNDNFVSEDYSESSGLLGNGTSKGLQTGLLRSAISSDASLHYGVFVYTRASVDNRIYAGYAADNGAYTLSLIQARAPATLAMFIANNAVSVGNSGNVSHADGDLMIGCISGVGSGLLRFYINGLSAATGVGRDTSSSAIQYGVFAYYRDDTETLTGHSDARIGGYTFGKNLTDSESAAYATIWDTFLKALGRR